MHDMNTTLANFASELEARAVRADQQAEASESRAKMYDAYGATGMELGRPETDRAAKLRGEAAEHRYRASEARKGFYVVDPRRVPDQSENAIMGLAAKHGRTVAVSARDWPVVAAAFLTPANS